MSYFQGGDFVELLSAQGKAPASTWKLQGKIIKSFDKAIKGNAFQMDGSSETKMQLPKTMTASSSSLGLTQRFLVLQLLVPHTRSFSVEIGFSDFQKIRRRLLFASAFREMAMTTLHVQIPISSCIPRDLWMNFVFDLQALTEHFFPASSYRSVESICISGSCRLKRVFTMKDAPFCQALKDQLKTQMLHFRQQRLQSKDPVSVPITVAGFAEMKEIPKQFVFTAAPSCLPIPTEYFLVSTERGTNQPPANAAPSAAVGPLIKAASSARAPKTGEKRTATISDKVKPKSTGVNASGRSATNRTAAVEGALFNDGRPILATPSRVLTTQHEASERIVRIDTESKRLATSPAADPGFMPPRFSSRVDSISREIPTKLHRSLLGTPQLPSSTSFDCAEEVANEHDGIDLGESRTRDREPPAHHAHNDRRDEPDPTTASKRKQHRQHVLSEIQLKLDELTTKAHVEEERSRELFLSRTSLRSELIGSLEHKGQELEHFANQTPYQVSEKRALQTKVKSVQSSSPLGDWHDSEMLRSPEPMVLRRACAAKKKSDIVFSSSIFFRRSDSSPAALPDQHIDESTSQTKKLFDWDSMLEDSAVSLPGPKKTTASESAGSTRNQTSLRARAEASESSTELFVERSVNPSASDQTLSPKPLARSIVSSKDADVVRILNDKLSDHLDAASKLAEGERMEALEPESRWERMDAAQQFVREGDEEERDDLLQSSFDFSLSPAILHPVIPENQCVDMPKPQQSGGRISPLADSEAFSLDLTGRVRELTPPDDVAVSPTGTDNDGRSGPPSDDLDDGEESFDFDDLVVRDRNSSRKTRRSERPKDISLEQTAIEVRTTVEKCRKETKPPKTTRAESNTSMKRTETSVTRQPAKATCPSNSLLQENSTRLRDESRLLARAPVSSRVMSSSYQRLANLLESTDWSQLPLSSTVASPVQPTKSSTTAEHPRAKTAQNSSPTKGGTSSSLELIYDPILRCYYDPVGKKYYTLAK